MRWAYAGASALIAMVAIAGTAVVAGLSVGRVLATLGWALPIFLLLGACLGAIGRATADEIAEAEMAPPPEVPLAPAPGGAPQGT